VEEWRSQVQDLWRESGEAWRHHLREFWVRSKKGT
jgi:hypothetical protein